MNSDQMIRSAPLFAGIDPEAVSSLIEAMTRIELKRGHVLFEEGELGETFYLVSKGKMKLGRSSPDGRENLLAVLGPGEMIGELTLFDPGTRTATATAVTDANLVSLSHSNMVTWLAVNPAASQHLLASLARRLRKTNEALADLVFSDVPGRVAKALLDLAERFGEVTGEGVHVRHELTQEELAQLVGASRETVNKALADFVARNWIQLAGLGVVLLDVERLARRAR
jgi:CRP-like cAMP-binding protein